MKFEKLQDYEISDSEEESQFQMLFIPGFGGPELWKHQINYFSDRFRTLTFRTEGRSLESVSEAVKSILDRKDLENVILVGSDVGNLVAREHGRSQKVSANVLTGPTGNLPTPGNSAYRLITGAASRKAKIARELFFSGNTDYRVAEDFTSDFEPMDPEEYVSYRDEEAVPVKNALYIRGKDDRFSDKSDRERLEPDVSFRKLSGGSFCFYEKPEEFNKAVFDFTQRLTEFMESKEIRQRREENRSLGKFRQSSLEVDAREW